MVKQEIYIPTELNDIPLYKYLQFVQIDPEASEDFKAKRMLQIFCDISPQDFRNIKHQDIENLLFKLNNVLNSQPKLERTFDLNGVKYGIIPNFDEKSFGEFIDIDNITDYKKDLDRLMSIIYRKVIKSDGHRYEIEPYKSSYKFKDIPTGIALGALVFFWTIGRDCLNATLKFTKKTQMQMKDLKGFPKNGNGTAQSLDYATETLEGLMKSLLSATIPSYFGLPIKAIWLPYNEKK